MIDQKVLFCSGTFWLLSLKCLYFTPWEVQEVDNNVKEKRDIFFKNYNNNNNCKTTNGQCFDEKEVLLSIGKYALFNVSLELRVEQPWVSNTYIVNK